jgi:hypothetical protein
MRSHAALLRLPSPDRILSGVVVHTRRGIFGGVDACNNTNKQLSASGWDTGNHSVATANSVSGSITPVGAGSTTDFAYITNHTTDSRGYCRYFSGVPTFGTVNVSCAVPTNYQGSCSDAGNGVLSCQYTWNSSTGNLPDLSACTVREYVTYPGTSPFIWKSPPYAPTQTPFPVTLGGPATTGTAPDTHGHPSFVTPYSADSFTATQYYQYICPCANGGQPVNIMGPLSISRSITFISPSGKWQYTATKSGVTASTLLP